MRSLDPTLSSLPDAAEAVAAFSWPKRPPDDRYGIEIEAFPILHGPTGPGDRLRLHGPGGAVDLVDRIADEGLVIHKRPTDDLAYPTADGGRITFEPGAQVEHSTAPHTTVNGLAAEVDEVWDSLERGFGSAGVALIPLGVDPWHQVAEVPQQQRAERYLAMDRYFESRWPAGALMMRNTCSIQVNLDAGSGRVRDERWLAANLLSPVVTAMFASSPNPGGVSARAQAWQAIDPTRTGLPTFVSDDDASPESDTIDKALSANVMFVTRDGRATPVDPGWPFSDWVERGHPEFGRPTSADLGTHLSTVFPEVRPRNSTLEMRAPDALPRRWWMVPVVVLSALLYDHEARGQTIEMLLPAAPHLGSLWKRASTVGLNDPTLRGLSEKLAHLAIDAACSDDASGWGARTTTESVSYTHLTLPTIYSV